MSDSRQRHELGILLFVANRALEQRVFDAVVAAGITDITLAQEVLGWRPHVALDEGLRRTIAYFERLLTERGVGAARGTVQTA